MSKIHSYDCKCDNCVQSRAYREERNRLNRLTIQALGIPSPAIGNEPLTPEEFDIVARKLEDALHSGGPPVVLSGTIESALIRQKAEQARQLQQARENMLPSKPKLTREEREEKAARQREETISRNVPDDRSPWYTGFSIPAALRIDEFSYQRWRGYRENYAASGRIEDFNSMLSVVTADVPPLASDVHRIQAHNTEAIDPPSRAGAFVRKNRIVLAIVALLMLFEILCALGIIT